MIVSSVPYFEANNALISLNNNVGNSNIPVYFFSKNSETIVANEAIRSHRNIIGIYVRK